MVEQGLANTERINKVHIHSEMCITYCLVLAHCNTCEWYRPAWKIKWSSTSLYWWYYGKYTHVFVCTCIGTYVLKIYFIKSFYPQYNAIATLLSVIHVDKFQVFKFLSQACASLWPAHVASARLASWHCFHPHSMRVCVSAPKAIHK